MVGVRVEPRRPRLLHRPQERERRERGARGVRVVVAARPGHAAGDLRGAERRHRDASVDRVAHLRVVDRALDDPLPRDALVLGTKEGRVVRLVPGDPVPHGRQPAPVGRPEPAAVAARGRGREVLQVAHVPRRHVHPRSAVRPRRRADDREDDLHPVLRRVVDRAVVGRPVVGPVVRIGRVRRPPLGDAVRAAPDEVDADQLRLQRRQHRKGLVRVAVEDLRVVEDPVLEEARGARRGNAEPGGHDENGRDGQEASRQRSVPQRTRRGAAAGPRPVESRAPSPATGARA